MASRYTVPKGSAWTCTAATSLLLLVYLLGTVTEPVQCSTTSNCTRDECGAPPNAATLQELSAQLAAMQAKMDDWGRSTGRAIETSRGSRFWYTLQGAFWTLALLGLAGYVLWNQLARARKRSGMKAAAAAVQSMGKEEAAQLLGSNVPAWMTFPDHTRVDWVNAIVDQAWPRISAACSANAGLLLDPLIRQSKPAWVQEVRLLGCNFGDRAPLVRSVKVYPAKARGEEVVMEYDFHWDGKQEMRLLIMPLPRTWAIAPAVGRFLSKMLVAKVTVEDIICNGRLRVAFRPLMDHFPIAGALQASLVEMPDFSFNIHAYGGDVTLLPGIEAWINAFMRDQVLRPYVLPEYLTIPLAPEGRRMDWMEKPAGMLQVELIEATDVPKMDLFSKSDPFVRLQVREGRRQQSGVRPRTDHPVWKEQFHLLVHEPAHQELLCVLLDHDQLSFSDEIGRAKVSLKDLTPGEAQDLWLEVRPEQQHSARRGRHGGGKGRRHMPGPAPGVVGLEGAKAEGLAGVKAELVQQAARVGVIKPCRLHIKVTYFSFGADELRALTQPSGELPPEPQLPISPFATVDPPFAADEAITSAEGGPGGQAAPLPAHNLQALRSNPSVMNTLQGGVLYIRLQRVSDPIRKPAIKGGAFMRTAITARVCIGPFRRYSGVAKLAGGEAAWEDETLELVLGADVVRGDGRGTNLHIQLWDYRLRNHFMGDVSIPLKDVIRRKRWRDAWNLQGVRHGKLAMELRWLGVLEGA